MRLWQRLKSLFDARGAQPMPPPRLDASSETALSDSIRALPSQKRGWITIEEGRHLFSSLDDQYAFGEMDEQGKTNLASFAARIGHRCAVAIMPVEGRIYFKAN